MVDRPIIQGLPLVHDTESLQVLIDVDNLDRFMDRRAGTGRV
jgi:hypothetical protein